MNGVRTDATSQNQYNKTYNKSHKKTENKKPSPKAIPEASPEASQKLKDKEIKYLKEEMQGSAKKAHEQLMEQGMGTSASKETPKNSPQKSDRSLKKLEKDKIRLKSNYNDLRDALRECKATSATLFNFMEQLNNPQISLNKRKQIVDNIISICKEQIPKSLDSEEICTLKLVQNYAQRERLAIINEEISPRRHLPQKSNVSPEQKNQGIISALTQDVQKLIEENKALSSKQKKEALKSFGQIVDNYDTQDKMPFFEEIHNLCEQYVPSEEMDKILAEVQETRIRIMTIRPHLDIIEKSPMTPAKSSMARSSCFCSILCDLFTDKAKIMETKRDRVFEKLENTKKELGEDLSDLEALHKTEKTYIDPKMQEIYINRFSGYVAEEMEHNRANDIVNNLIDIGQRLDMLKLKSKLSDDQLKIIEGMKTFTQNKLEKIPINVPDDKDHHIHVEIPIRTSLDEKERNYKISILKTPTGQWNVSLGKKGKKEIHSFPGYSEAALWVHSQLDREFCDHIGLNNQLMELVQASRVLQTFTDWTKNRAENMGTHLEIPSTHSSLVSTGVGTAQIGGMSMLGHIGDLMGLALILPSLFMAIEANEKREKRNEFLEKIERDTQELKDNIDKISELTANYPKLNIEISKSTKTKDYGAYAKQIESEKKRLFTRIEKSSKNEAEKLQSQIEELDTILQGIDKNKEISKKIKELKKHCRKLREEEVEKATAATTNIIGVLASFANSAISLHHLQTTGSYAVTAATGASQATLHAALSLGIISGVCFIVAGGVQTSIDSRRVHHYRMAKNEIKAVFNKIGQAENFRGEKILNEEDANLLRAVRKMQSRKVNNAIASGAIGIGSDLTLIGVGGASIAVAAGAVCPPALAVIPVAAGLAIGAKVLREKVVKEVADKQQENYQIKAPLRSDIGIIHSLRNRIKQEDAGAALIVKELIEGFYKMSKTEFMTLTEGFDEKYAELELTSQRTSQIVKQSLS